MALLSTNTFSSIWIGESLSLMEQLSINSFLSNKYSFKLYCYNEIENVPAGTTLSDANKILPFEKIKNISSPNWIADYFRYLLLSSREEVWVDLDMVCLKRMPFLDNEYVLGKERAGVDRSVVNIGFIKAPMDSPLLKELIEFCEELLNNKKFGWGGGGIKIFDGLVRQHGLVDYALPVDYFYKINHDQVGSFLDPKFDFTTEILNDEQCYCTHLWRQCWKNRIGLSIKEISPSCFYAYLIEEYLQG